MSEVPEKPEFDNLRRSLRHNRGASLRVCFEGTETGAVIGYVSEFGFIKRGPDVCNMSSMLTRDGDG